MREFQHKFYAKPNIFYADSVCVVSHVCTARPLPVPVVHGEDGVGDGVKAVELVRTTL